MLAMSFCVYGCLGAVSTSASVPRLHDPVQPEFIPGLPPDLVLPPAGCRFHPRCAFAFEPCDRDEPPWLEAGGTQHARCWLLGPSAGEGG